MNYKAALVIASLIFITACIPQARFVAPDYQRPERIAILPTINNTTDVKGSIVIRHLLYAELQDKDYTQLIHPDLIDSLLNLEGITDGGQLTTITDSVLYNILDADGLIYLTLLECEFSSIGINTTKKVKANFKLYHSEQQLIWEDEQEVDKGKSLFDTLIDALADPEKAAKESMEQLGDKAVKMWLTEHELKDEMLEIIQNSIKTLP